MRKAALVALSVLVVFAARGEWLSEAAVRRAARTTGHRFFRVVVEPAP